MAKRKEQPPSEGAPEWMATFSDLMNLLLCFFVLLFASSTMDEGKIQKIAAAFNNTTFTVIDTLAFSLSDGALASGGVAQIPNVNSILTEAGKNIEGETGEQSDSEKDEAEELSDYELQQQYSERGEEQSEEMYEEIEEVLEQELESYIVDNQVMTDYNNQCVILDISGAILFDSGDAKVKDEAKVFLTKIAAVLSKYKYNIIEIEGHTDNVPMHSVSFENNRELSTERAREVYEYIITQEDFIDANIKIAGYGESRPIASNSTEEGRARNRRVTIKIYNQLNSVN